MAHAAYPIFRFNKTASSVASHAVCVQMAQSMTVPFAHFPDPLHTLYFECIIISRYQHSPFDVLLDTKLGHIVYTLVTRQIIAE